MDTPLHFCHVIPEVTQNITPYNYTTPLGQTEKMDTSRESSGTKYMCIACTTNAQVTFRFGIENTIMYVFVHYYIIVTGTPTNELLINEKIRPLSFCQL